jgi:hypothetical protein
MIFSTDNHEAHVETSGFLFSFASVRIPISIFAGFFSLSALLSKAQVATDQTLNPTVARPQPQAGATTSLKVPERSQIDEIFKETSLGKEADERRLHIEWRELQNEVANELDIVAAKQSAEHAQTDFEKRQQLRDYYELYYGRMRVLARSSEMRSALDKLKIAHLSQLTQAHVRHETDSELPTPSPTAKKRQKGRINKYLPSSG